MRIAAMRIGGRAARCCLLLLASGLLPSRSAAVSEPVSQAAEVSLVPQTPHAGDVLALAELRRPRLLASAGQDGLVRLWDAATGRAVHGFRVAAAQEDIRSLVASRLEPWLAVALDTNGTTGEALVELWDAGSSQRLQSFRGHPDTSGLALALAPDDKTLALVGGGWLTLWKTETGERLVTLAAAGGGIAFLDEHRIVYQGETATVVLDVRTGRSQTVDTGPGNTLAVSPDGALLAHCTKEPRVSVWDLATGRRLGEAGLLGGSECRSLQFSSDGRTLLIGAWRNQIYRLQSPTWSELWGFLALPSSFGALLILADDRVAVSSGPGGDVEIRDLGTAAELIRLGSQRSTVTALAFSASPRLFASGDSRGAVRLWDLSTGEVTVFDPASAVESRHPIQAIAFSPDNHLLASTGRAGLVKVRDLTTGTLILNAKLLGGADLAFHGNSLLAACSSSEVKIWDITRPDLQEVTLEAPDNADRIAFSGDGRWIATTGPRSLWIYDWEAGRWLLRRDDLGSDILNNVALLRFTGPRTLLRLANRLVETWDLRELPDAEVTRDLLPDFWFSALVVEPQRGEFLAGSGAGDLQRLRFGGDDRGMIAAHEGRISSLAVSAAGDLLASGGAEIKLWSLPDLRLLATVQPLPGRAWLAFSPEGFFDGTDEAWNLVPFQIRSEPLRSYQAEQFFNVFYQPDLLADLTASSRPMSEILRERKDSRASQEIAGYRDSHPPRVRILSPLPTVVRQAVALPPTEWSSTGNRNWRIPALQSTFETQARAPLTSREVLLDVEVTDTGSGARDCRVFRNRSRVPWPMRDPGSGRLSVPVRLVAGRNELSVYCFNDDRVRSNTDTVTVDGSPTLARAPVAWVLAFGVDEYGEKTSSLNLHHASADARELAAVLDRNLPRDGGQQVVAVSLVDRDATRTTLLSALAILAGKESFRAGLPEPLSALRPAEPEDSVILFFAGHGTEDGERYYLIPSGAVPGDATHPGAVSDRDLESALADLDAGRFLLILDTCQSGGAIDSPEEEKRLGPLNTRGLAQLAYEKGIYVLAAAQRDQAAWELRKLEHGVLTYALLTEGLKKREADKQPPAGSVSAQEWLGYAVARVPDLMVETLGDAYVRGELTDPDLIAVLRSGVRGTKQVLEAAALQRPRAYIRRGAQEFFVMSAEPR